MQLSDDQLLQLASKVGLESDLSILLVKYRIKIFPQAKTKLWFATAEGDTSDKCLLGSTPLLAAYHAILRLKGEL